jgi:hypothetical protein
LNDGYSIVADHGSDIHRLGEARLPVPGERFATTAIARPPRPPLMFGHARQATGRRSSYGRRLSRKLSAVWSTHNRPGALRELSLALRMRQAHAQRHRLMRAAQTGEVVVIH